MIAWCLGMTSEICNISHGSPRSHQVFDHDSWPCAYSSKLQGRHLHHHRQLLHEQTDARITSAYHLQPPSPSPTTAMTKN